MGTVPIRSIGYGASAGRADENFTVSPGGRSGASCGLSFYTAKETA